jgi:hypothetical protein
MPGIAWGMSPARGDSKILGEVISIFDGSCHGHRAKNGCICSLGVGRTAQYVLQHAASGIDGASRAAVRGASGRSRAFPRCLAIEFRLATAPRRARRPPYAHSREGASLVGEAVISASRRLPIGPPIRRPQVRCSGSIVPDSVVVATGMGRRLRPRPRPIPWAAPPSPRSVWDQQDSGSLRRCCRM